MTRIERKLFDLIRNNIFIILFVCISVISVLLRIYGLKFPSDDYRRYLNSWWIVISNQGIGGLSKQVGNYNIPYQIIIFILTQIEIKGKEFLLSWYKTIYINIKVQYKTIIKIYSIN